MRTIYTDPKFNVQEDGFQFVNAFENSVYTGVFGWSIRTYGRCGGMSYAALDYFLSKQHQISKTNEMPPDGDVLADFILKRQLHTFSSVGDEFIAATLLPGGADIYYGRCLPPVGESYKYYLQQIKSLNKPCNIGCAPIASGIQDIGNGHQVLGIGVTEDIDPEKVLIHVYDSNYPNQEKVLKLNKRKGIWELRNYNSGKIGSIRREFKAWFPDPGYQFVEPDIYEKHSPYIDMSYQDLRRWKAPLKEDLQNFILYKANLSGNNIDSCDLDQVNASYASFSGISAKSCTFRNTDLIQANFIGANLRNSTFDGADMQESKMNNTELSDAHFEGTDLSKAHFIGAKMNNTCLKSSVIEDGLFFNLSAVNTDFNGANLEDTNFHAAALNGVSLKGATLTNAQFLNASLRDCKFSNAKLRGANFSNIPLANCSFYRAYMYKTGFSNSILNTVDFRGSDLRFADFRGASLDHIKFDEHTRWEHSRWQGAKLSNYTGLYPPLLNYLISQGVAFG